MYAEYAKQVLFSPALYFFFLPMKLREALQVVQRPQPEATPYHLELVSGFEPLHLRVFLAAHARLRLQMDRPVVVRTGLFGDFGGNLERALQSADAAPVAAVLEWPDLHPVLGWREAAYVVPGGGESALVEELRDRLKQWSSLLASGARQVALALPALPLPPWVGTRLKGQRSRLVLEIDGLVQEFAREAAGRGVRVAERPAGAAWDPAKHLANGFPYNLEFTDSLASHLADLILPAPPKKGLITDLDQTLWSGVVGDDGPEGVHWDLDHQARPHGWWQQFLAALAGRGTLLGVASKNDKQPVEQALAREEMLVPAASLFPREVHWEEKAGSIQRIAAAWNVGLDSLVFVDDNPWEVEAVRQALPQVECVLFPAGDASGVVTALGQLADLFGVEAVGAEDLLRAASLRQRPELEAQLTDSGAGLEGRLAQLGSRLRLDVRRPPARRALELINKTNQFNLNGIRWEEADWLAWCARPEARVALLGYEDRFGPLGNIAVVAAEQHGEVLTVRSWVMSCRAFSRRIEFATLRLVLQQWPSQRIEFDWRRTERNGPTAAALELLVGSLPGSGKLGSNVTALQKSLPPLYLDKCEILEN